MKLTEQEIDYSVVERAGDDLKEHGSIEKTIAHLKSELSKFEFMCNKYSTGCLEYGITFTKLKIEYLEKLK